MHHCRVLSVFSTTLCRNAPNFSSVGSKIVFFSTKTADTLPKLSREYLATWLGSDMSGSSYHERMMNASKLPHKAVSQAAQTQGEKTSPSLEQKARTEQTTMAENKITFPVISLNWGSATASSIEQDMADALMGMDSGVSCFLNMSLAGIEEELTAEQMNSLVTAAAAAIKRDERQISLLAAINCTDERMVSAAKASGLKIIATPPSTTRAQHAPVLATAVPQVQAETENMPPPASARVHYGTVRSGQQIYADGCSLVIIGSVNNGAEVMADGDIHVYGTLKGRAVAGLGGSANAHIFVRGFDASLIGIYDSFIAPDACAELKKLQGKEIFARLLKKNESAAEVRAGGAEVVDCGYGNSLVVSPL